MNVVDLKKQYDGKTVVNSVSFEIPKGNVISFIGPNGAGKSTLVQLLNGLLLSNYGEVVVFDKTLSNNKKIKLKDTRKRVGLVFQFPEAQLFDETVLKDVSFGPKNFGLDNPVELAREALSVVGIDESLYEKNPFNLSGGQMRRVAIAGVLAMKPEVLILDEPTAGLDPLGKNNLLNLIRDYNERTGNTVVFVSHNMDDVALVADRVIVMNDGEIALEGTVDEVYSQGQVLAGLGLDVPEITSVFIELNKAGFELGKTEYTVEGAKTAILNSLGKGGAI